MVYGVFAASFTDPNVKGLLLVIVVASSAPVRHGSPGGINCASGRPLREGRPYSIAMAAPSTVHSAFTCGLPPRPAPVSVTFCPASGTATVHARAIVNHVKDVRIEFPPPPIVVNAEDTCGRFALLYTRVR